MNEKMNYEQKYKQALETARKINNGEGVAAPEDWNMLEVIFPELKESESERIRKAIAEIVKNYGPQNANPKLYSDMLAWLEKQGEQKPSDKVEPEPYFYCKYGGTIPSCSDCKRNHNNSSFKTEEITTWFTPLFHSKQCIDYIAQLKKQGERKPTEWNEEDDA
jgi:hypothetical protein